MPGKKLEFPSRSSNEAFARAAAAAFASQLDPTMEELGDIKTAVSEAVTNAIVHAYPSTEGRVLLRCRILEGERLEILIRDCSDYQGLSKGYYRVAVRPKEENEELIRAIRDVIKEK